MKRNDEKARKVLEEKLQSLRERLDGMDETLREPEDDDFEEQAVDLDDDEVLQRLTAAGRMEAQRILDALRRMEAGTYGTCVTCGKDIPGSRLEAIPEAAECVECARRSAEDERRR